MSEHFPSSPSIEIRDDPAPESHADFFLEAALSLLPTLTEQQRHHVAEYVRTKEGYWQHVDGKDVLVVDANLQNNKVVFTINFHGEELQDEIPLE